MWNVYIYINQHCIKIKIKLFFFNIRIGLFKIINKIIKVMYWLNLLLKIKIHLIYYIIILKLVYKDYKIFIRDKSKTNS